jgi:hypothetical protein
MAKVVAVSRGYYGRMIRDIGDVFDVPDEIMADEGLRPSWVEIVGKVSAEPAAAAEPEKPAKAKPGPKAKPAPFADAPEPVRVQNEINNALGTAEPDWVAPAGGDI